jgi:acyl-coenzyme A thioesterase PaaI-like protein
MGHASLMRPARPLPTVRFVGLPLRLGSNTAAEIIAAKVARGHGTSTSGTLGTQRVAHRGWSTRGILRPI